MGPGRAASGPADGLHVPFSTAMSEAMLLPSVVLALGLLAALFFQMPRHLSAPAPVAPEL